MNKLEFHSEFIFRSPAWAFSDKIETVESIKEIAANKAFAEAIYIASPALYDEMQRWLRGELRDKKGVEKLTYSLYKYLNRMRSRCTPYGRFAACSVGNWGGTSELSIDNSIHTHTRLDMNFVCLLGQHLSNLPSVMPYLLFYPNNSIYAVGTHIRYTKYEYKDGRRNYTIVGGEKNEVLEKILSKAKNGADISTLAGLLVSEIITLDQAKAIIKEVIDSQLLVSELEPTVTGTEYMQGLEATLHKIVKTHPDEEIKRILELLGSVRLRMNKIDTDVNNVIEVYTDLGKELEGLNIEVNEKLLFQVDSFRESLNSGLAPSAKTKLLNALTFLQKFCPPLMNGDLNNFKTNFLKQYDEREIPLLSALDTESGIGYPGKDTAGMNPLIDDLPIMNSGTQESRINWDSRQSFLLQKLTQANKNSDYIVSFSDDEPKLSEQQKINLPITFTAWFKPVNLLEDKIHLLYFGGHSSASCLLGRFAHGNEKIKKIVYDVTRYEQDCLSDKIVAEIAHLPQDRMGNIIFRPVFRDYEIPYLAKSNLPEDRQIPLSDIMVSVRDNRIVLHSARLNKEIFPRLSSAHNFQSNSLPVYKFLGDIQTQDIDTIALTFNWGSLAKNFKFLPRAEYKSVVLSPATWNFIVADYEILIKNITSPDFIQHVFTWKEKWKMPRYILLKDSDNELLIDLESELSIKAFLDTIKKRPFIELTEFLFDPGTALVRDKEGRPYTNEIIAILFNKEYEKGGEETTKTRLLQNKTYVKETKRLFIPGSEWLYYKIYCGVKTADTILATTIKTLVEELQAKQLIEKWFFIRYGDPDIHIRLRLYNSDIDKNAQTSKIVCGYMESLQEQGMVSKVMLDTYTRELERYGNNAIEIAEDYFNIDSNAALALLDFAEKEKNEEIKWKYATRITDELLDNFKLDIGQKMKFIELLKEGYIREHRIDKSVVLQLDTKFRKLRPDIENILDRKKDYTRGIMPIMQLLFSRRMQIKSISEKLLLLKESGQLEVDLNSLLASYLHMSLNRIFKAKQRTYEMVIYDMLCRHYKSQIARVEKNRQEPQVKIKIK